MEIKLMDKSKVPFRTLKFGDIFLYGGVYYMKFYSSEDSKANVVDLKGTCTSVFNEDVLVSPVNGYFIVVSE